MSTQGTRTVTVTQEVTETRDFESSLVLQLLRKHFQIPDKADLVVQVKGAAYQNDLTLDELKFTLVSHTTAIESTEEKLWHPDREGRKVGFPNCPEGGRCPDQEHCMQGGSCKVAKHYAKKDQK